MKPCALAPLRAELDRLAEAGVRLEIWWRDDDAAEATPALDRLLAIAEKVRWPLALAVIPGVANEAVLSKFVGPLELTEDQWDVITGSSGGLTLNATYYLSSTGLGQITTTAPTAGGTFALPLGTALSSTCLMIQVGTATEN